MGCYVDNGSRDLKNYKGDVTNTPTSCQRLCTGYKFFSLQNGGQCFCSDTFGSSLSYSKKPDSECQAMNSGRPLYWGNAWRNAVYTVNLAASTTILSSQYIGCFVDNSSRNLKYYAGDIASDPADCKKK